MAFNWFKKKKPEPEPTPWKIDKVNGQWLRINTNTGECFFLEPEFERLLKIIKREKLSTTKAKKLFKRSKISLSQREVNEIIKPITKQHRKGKGRH